MPCRPAPPVLGRRETCLKGEIAESEFLRRATGMGLAVCKPFGNSARFDYVTVAPAGRDGRSGKVTKVQVKSAWEQARSSRGYIVRTKHAAPGGRSVAYRAGDVDIIAAYVAPKDAWYLLPLKEVGATLALFPGNRRSKHEKYREAWEVLWGRRRPERLPQRTPR